MTLKKILSRGWREQMQYSYSCGDSVRVMERGGKYSVLYVERFGRAHFVAPFIDVDLDTASTAYVGLMVQDFEGWWDFLIQRLRVAAVDQSGPL